MQGRGLNQRANEGREWSGGSPALWRDVSPVHHGAQRPCGGAAEGRDAASNSFLHNSLLHCKWDELKKSCAPTHMTPQPTILPKVPAWLLLAFQPLDSAGSSSISSAPFIPFFPSICLHAGRAEPVGREQSKGSRVWKHVRPLILIGADGPLSCWKNQRNVRSFQKRNELTEESIPRLQLLFQTNAFQAAEATMQLL